jgi:glutamyl-tRNA synthetase
MSQPVRVRFAPSPTGYMHVGNLHTALFNWLFAQHEGGAFILRIEDTDEVRSTESALGVIYEGLRWLGLQWDEGPDVGGEYGPYVQSERLDIYQGYFDQLLAEGKAYRCYCTPEELEERRLVMQARGLPPRYDGRCRHREAVPGRDSCIRLVMADSGQTVIEDLIQGEVTYENALAGDPVIGKTSGYPTYHFAVVVDDHLMKISHVIRAVEHLPNTQIHLQLQQALGLDTPAYAHLPIVLGADRTKLSKRHGAVSVTDYQQQGYLAEAMFNFLSLMGWSPSSEQEIFHRDEIIQRFTLAACSKSPAVFDLQKAEWINGEYIKALPADELARLVLPFLVEAELFEAEPDAQRWQWLVAVCGLMQERVRLLTTFTDWARYFFTDDYEYENRSREKWLGRPEIADRLEALADSMASLDVWDAENIEAAIRQLAADQGVKAAEVIHPTRAAVTGTTVGPSLFHLLELLPQATVTMRLRRSADLCRRGELAPVPEESATDEAPQ